MASRGDAVRPDAHGTGPDMLSEMVRGLTRRVGIGGGVVDELHANRCSTDRSQLPAAFIGAGRDRCGGGCAGRALLMGEYGSAEVWDTILRQAGQPRIGQAPTGASPTVRGRISDEDYVAFKQLEDATGRFRSELVREALHNLLTEHKLFS